VSECDLTELASKYDEVTVGEGPSGKSAIEGLVSDCTDYLSRFGGPSQKHVTSKFDLRQDDEMPFYLTIGGNFCDCCGKTPNEANLPVLFKCKACRLAWYCSASCQAECWANGHRDCCKKFGRFEKGNPALLQGLKKRPEINGYLVRVEDLQLNGRVVVRVQLPMVRSADEAAVSILFHHTVGEVFSVKKENLRHLRPMK